MNNWSSWVVAHLLDFLVPIGVAIIAVHLAALVTHVLDRRKGVGP